MVMGIPLFSNISLYSNFTAWSVCESMRWNWSQLKEIWNSKDLGAVLSHSFMFNSAIPGLQPARLLCPWGFSGQQYRRRLPCPPPGILHNPGIEAKSPTLQVDSWPSEPPGKPIDLNSWYQYLGTFPSYSQIS